MGKKEKFNRGNKGGMRVRERKSFSRKERGCAPWMHYNKEEKERKKNFNGKKNHWAMKYNNQKIIII
jgi:hypothetical protein